MKGKLICFLVFFCNSTRASKGSVWKIFASLSALLFFVTLYSYYDLPKAFMIHIGLINYTKGDERPPYLIHTPGCIIPDMDPFHPSLMKYKKPPKELECSKERPLTEESGTTLIFYKERAIDYHVPIQYLNCSYQGIRRVQENPKKYTSSCDKKFKMKESITITKRETKLLEDSVMVTCVNDQDKKSKLKPIYKAVHFFIQPFRADVKRKQFKAEFGERQKENLSVIIFGIDSVSRGNLQRHMPKTFEYITQELELIDLKGFNKVGDNTDPNLSALLGGMTYTEMQDSCTHKNSRTRFDDCPLIWKNFSSHGYPTAYAEDSPWMGVFHYRKDGFCELPTDYYNRHYYYASEKAIGISNGKQYNGNYCQGGRKSISIIQDYSLAVAESMKDIPYFGFYWTASVSHEGLAECLMADTPTLKYLKQLKERGYLNHTILLFISDHGLRFGEFRKTYTGRLEERLPFVMFGFPKWFQEQNSEAINSLRINTRRLTSTFDLHVTLQDILGQAYVNPVERSYIPAKPNHGQSLFLEVPENRTCEDAGIPPHYCSCENSKEADPHDAHLKEAAEKAIYEINKGLKAFPLCVRLSLKKVLNGRIGTANEAMDIKTEDSIATDYFVTFVTTPGDAMLESTLRHHAGEYILVSEVSRINAYGKQSHCISDQVYRKFCLCKDMLKL